MCNATKITHPLCFSPAFFFFGAAVTVAVIIPPPIVTVPTTVIAVPLGSKLRTSIPTVIFPPGVSVSPAITTFVTGPWFGETPVAKVVGAGLGNVMISPPTVIALPGYRVWELITKPPLESAVMVEPSITTMEVGVGVGSGM
jgi:hypothetical protein